ncbi:hypothetical protein GF373_08410 [bacterium]|nr:hypothetical protein [bacterium]
MKNHMRLSILCGLMVALGYLCANMGWAESVGASAVTPKSIPSLAPSVKSNKDIQPATASIGSVSSATKTYNPIISAIRHEMGAENEIQEEPENKFLEQNQGELISIQLGRMLMSLGAVLAIVLGLAWLAKRYFFKQAVFGGGYITYLTSFNLSQKSKLHLIKIGGETLLIGEGNNQLSLISKVSLEEISNGEFPLDANEEEEESHAYGHDRQYDTFKNKLSHWQQSLDTQSAQDEVKQSLLVLGGLSKRLAKKGGFDE